MEDLQMSYEIVYNRQFLRVGDKIIPLVLIGSNNTWETNYESGRERRSRDWNPLMNNRNSIPLMTEDEIMEKAQSWTGGPYQQHFMRNAKWVDDKGLLSFCKNGIKNAATLEELKELARNPNGVYVRCYLSVWFKNEKGEQQNKAELQREIHISDDLLAYIGEVNERLSQRSGETIYIGIEYPNDKAVRYPKEKPKRRNQLPRMESDYWVIKAGRSDPCFVQKLSARSLRFSFKPEYAKQFKTQAIAEKWVKEKSLEVRFRLSPLEYQHVA
jgi:hypothetical protein